MNWINRWFKQIDGRWTVGFAGGLFLFFTAGSLLRRRYVRHQRAGVCFDQPLGEVEISNRALRQLIEHSANRIQGVRRSSPELVPSQDGFRIRLPLWVEQGIQSGAVKEKTRQQVQASLKHILGLEASEVRVVVHPLT